MIIFKGNQDQRETKNLKNPAKGGLSISNAYMNEEDNGSVKLLSLEMRTDLLVKVKREIKNKTYRVKSKEIAEKIIRKIGE
ncbi:MAG: flagellar biosynthesis anti-sigma factor FlgM [Nitrospinota bacterium]